MVRILRSEVANLTMRQSACYRRGHRLWRATPSTKKLWNWKPRPCWRTSGALMGVAGLPPSRPFRCGAMGLYGPRRPAAQSERPGAQSAVV